MKWVNARNSIIKNGKLKTSDMGKLQQVDNTFRQVSVSTSLSQQAYHTHYSFLVVLF